MVYESPAAGRSMVCRKHSPWTMERDRKKSKAHLGSPECHEALSEGLEEEEEEPDDHEMTEQEAQVLACLGQLSVALGSHGDAECLGLSRAGSAPDGQRRKVRGSRALSASYHSRLRLCMLNDKGGPLSHSSRSYSNGTDCGQENTPPVMFAAAEQTKCWLGRHHSPVARTASDAQPHHIQAASGATVPSQARMQGQATADGQSLITAAAVASYTRLQKQNTCDSPAPKARTHRRSLSGVGAEASCGLNDSAEALHGHDACSGDQQAQPGLRLQPNDDQPHDGCSASLASTFSGSAPSGQLGAGASDRDGSGNRPAAQAHPFIDGISRSSPRCTSPDLPDQTSPRPQQLTSTSCSLSVAPMSFVARYGIAAFGIPASVQSCFADASAQRPAPDTSKVRSESVAPAQLSLPNPDAALTAEAADASVSVPMGQASADSAGSSVDGAAAAAAVVSTNSGVGTPLAGSGPLLAGLGRYPSAGPGAGKALADSAEELELRRLAQRQPHMSSSSQLSRHDVPLEREPTGQPQLVAEVIEGPLNRSTSAAPAASAFAPFDLAGLARSAGSILCSAGLSAGASANSFCVVAPEGACDVAGFAPSPPSVNLCQWRGPDVHGSQASHGAATWHKEYTGHHSFSQRGHNTSGWNADCTGDDGAQCSMHADVDTPGAGRGTQGGAGDVRDLGRQSAAVPAAENGSSGGCSGVVVDQDFGLGVVGGEDGEDGTPWLRTSQAPDLDDPSSAGKYSAVLLRRLQAVEHEELYGAAATAAAAPSAASGLYHLQGRCDTGLGYGDFGTRNGSGKPPGSNNSSMEPSPMPRLSSRFRRLRASPCAGGGGSSGPLTSPASSHLGTRSRSAGVTPGGETCRRLRRRSDLLVPDQIGQAIIRHRTDVDEAEDHTDAVGGAEYGPDEDMHDVGRQHHCHRVTNGRRAGDGGTPEPLAPHGSGSRPSRPEPSSRLLGTAAGQSGARHDPTSFLDLRVQSPRMRRQAGVPARCGDPDLNQLHRQQHTRVGDEFLSGLMDYDDDGVEYATPPHTPLRGIRDSHDQDPATAPRVAFDSLDTKFVLGGGGAIHGHKAPDATTCQLGIPGRASLDFGRGGGQLRVSFACQRMDNSHPAPKLAAGGLHDEGSCCAVLAESLSSTQDFNKCITRAANNNDRGSAERLWHEMCSRGVDPDINTLNALLRCLSRSAADPDEAQLLVREICNRGGFSANGTSQRLLEEICFRFEQLNGNTLAA